MNFVGSYKATFVGAAFAEREREKPQRSKIRIKKAYCTTQKRKRDALLLKQFGHGSTRVSIIVNSSSRVRYYRYIVESIIVHYAPPDV
jgi:hypothetical protein